MTTSGGKFIDSLPPDVIQIVATYLPAREKLALRLTCRSLLSTLNTPAAWRRIHWINYNKKERKSLKSLLKLSQTAVEEVILTGPIVESSLSELYKCRELRKVSGFKLTPAQVSSLLSSLPKLTHLSIEVNNMKTFIPLLPALGRLSQLAVNCEKSTLFEEFVTSWGSNGYKPESLILISRNSKSYTQYSLPVAPHSATFIVCEKKGGPLGLGILKPVKYYEFEPGKGCTPHKHARSNELDDVKSLAASFDPTLACEDKNIVALSSGASLTNYGRPVEYSFADFAPKIASIEIYFFPPGALSYVAHHCPKLQELRIGLADHHGSLPADLLEGLSDISQKCKELRGLNVLQLHARILKVSAVSFWEVISSMSRLTHIGVPYCLLLPPSLPGGLDDGQSQTSEESAPKRRCVDHKATEDIRRAIMLLKSVKAVQLLGVTGFRRDCELCYDFSGLQLSCAVCETLSAFKHLKYIYFEKVEKVDLDCLLSYCRGIQYLSFDRCSVSLSEETSSFVNIRQLHIYHFCGERDFDLTKFGDTLASAVKLTHLSLEMLPNVSVEKICTLIQKVPSLVFLQIVCPHPGSKSFVREINTKVNNFTKSIKRSYLEFHCRLGDKVLDNSDIDKIWPY